MSSNFRRNNLGHQAILKLQGQKLFKMDRNGGLLSSLGGLPIAARVAQDSGLIEMAAERISEWRKPDAVTFSKFLLLFQRVLLTACGSSSALDCSFLKNDPALKSALGLSPDDSPLPSQSTQARMEENVSEATIEALEGFPLEFFFTQFKFEPRTLTIYFDGTAIRTFGVQQKSTYRGGKKYSQTQYFPLVATTDGGELLLAQLREGGHSDAKSVDVVVKLLRAIKAKWKHVQLTIVMDTGFNSPKLIETLEQEKVLYAIGYPCTSSVKSKIKDLIRSAERDFKKLHGEPKYTGKGASKRWQSDHEAIRSLSTEQRMEAEKAMNARHVRWVYQIEHDGKNWDTERPVITRIDVTDKGVDIRCIVTNIRDGSAESIYDNYYCRRARVETFIKEKKSHCRVPLSCQKFTANQFRFSGLQALSYMLLHLLRNELPPSQRKISMATVRKRLLLVPVHIEITPRTLHWQLSSVHPYAHSIISIGRKLHARTA